MSKYYVAAEADRYCGAGMFGSILGFTLKYFTVQIEGPVNADILYEAINKDRDEKHKTGNIVSWSKIEE